jgi:hypothetical protein
MITVTLCKKHDDTGVCLLAPPLFLLPSPNMPPHHVNDSNSDSNDEAPAAQPPKKSHASRDDLSGNQTLDNSICNATSRKPSEKQSANGVFLFLFFNLSSSTSLPQRKRT